MPDSRFLAYYPLVFAYDAEGQLYQVLSPVIRTPLSFKIDNKN